MTKAGKLVIAPPRGHRAAMVNKAKREQPSIRVVCAFCRGKGRDPFNLMSPLSACQVCGGRGARKLHPPLASCAFCKGTGVYPGLRMTCTTCNGVGTVEIPTHTQTCPGCGGTGRAADAEWPDSTLSCNRCKGKGVV